MVKVSQCFGNNIIYIYNFENSPTGLVSRSSLSKWLICNSLRLVDLGSVSGGLERVTSVWKRLKVCLVVLVGLEILY